MSYLSTMIIFAVLYLLLGGFILFLLNRWINRGASGSKPHTRLTAFMAVVSLVGMLIMATAFVINGSLLDATRVALIAQAEGIAPIVPTLEVEALHNPSKIISSYLVARLERKEETNHYIPSSYPIIFVVRNRGQGKIDDASFSLSELNGTFYADKRPVEAFGSLESKTIVINFRFSKCGYGELEEFNSAFDDCTSVMPEGFYKWNLTVDCLQCKEKKMCYSFSNCLYKDHEGYEACKINYSEKEHGLRKIVCASG